MLPNSTQGILSKSKERNPHASPSSSSKTPAKNKKAIKDHEDLNKDKNDDHEIERELEGTHTFLMINQHESMNIDASMSSCSMISNASSMTWHQMSTNFK